MSETYSGRGRGLKQHVLVLLQAADFENSLRELSMLPGRKVINPLFSFLLHSDQKVRWRAVIAMGAVIENLTLTNIEDARVIIRRLMWSLNEESGGIGWGAPEVIGEALARSEKLSTEYSAILASYADERGNFLEHEGLQQGLLWAWARLAAVRPHLLRGAGDCLTKYLESKDATVRGLAALAIGLTGTDEAVPKLRTMLDDDSEFHTYIGNQAAKLHVKDVAKEALQMLCTKKGDAPDPSKSNSNS
ncbi:MAG: HEAT repeat domain-containing protein [Deltaproteobacteria bacterium]|jgi:HEAT repeat protein|nr:HEAT repeat domain-containing protein [Deltaproteobacteria bacterium]